jgi:hypothetical protein
MIEARKEPRIVERQKTNSKLKYQNAKGKMAEQNSKMGR